MGVVQQSSYGPLSNKFATILTPPDPEAAPLNLNVQSDPANETNLVITWTSSCPKMVKAVGYVVSIRDRCAVLFAMRRNDRTVFSPQLRIIEVKTKRMSQIARNETKDSTFKVIFPGNYGAEYNITLSTAEDMHISASTKYQIPPCAPPHQVIVYQDKGGYMVTWDVKNGSPSLSSRK